MTALTTIAEQLDPDTVYVSRHVIDRYMLRREGRRMTRREVEQRIRELLWRVADQHPRMVVRPPHQPARFFVGGQLVWVVSADYQSVVTFWKRSNR